MQRVETNQINVQIRYECVCLFWYLEHWQMFIIMFSLAKLHLHFLKDISVQDSECALIITANYCKIYAQKDTHNSV